MFRIGGMAIAAAALLGIVDTTTRADAQAEPTYFVGESRMTTPDGKLIQTSLSLVKRLVNPAKSQIEEHVLSVRENGPAKVFVTVLEVKGNAFVVTEKSKAFEGEGELIGDAWNWKAWKSVTRLHGGAGTVTSDDRLIDHGLSAKKTFTAADGKVQVTFEDSLTTISARTYEILYAKLAPPEKK